jgi:hypothetical protein
MLIYSICSTVCLVIVLVLLFRQQTTLHQANRDRDFASDGEDYWYTKFLRANKIVNSLLDRNGRLRDELEAAQLNYDNLFVKYAASSLHATVVSIDEAEILGPPLPKVSDIFIDTEPAAHWIDGLGYVRWVEGKGHVPLDPQPRMMAADEGGTPHLEAKLCVEMGCKPYVENDAELDIDIPIDYYLVDQDQA